MNENPKNFDPLKDGTENGKPLESKVTPEVKPNTNLTSENFNPIPTDQELVDRGQIPFDPFEQAKKKEENEKKIAETKAKLEQILSGAVVMEDGNFTSIEKTKQEKFDSLKIDFEKKYENPKPTEYNLQEISENLKNAYLGKNIQEIDKIFNSLPKDVIENLKNNESTSFFSKNSFDNWQKLVGSRIGQLGNDLVEYYDLKSGNKLGMIPKDSKSYLITVSNAARFFPKEISQSDIKKAIDIFTDEQKLNFATGGKDFIGVANGHLKNIPEELNVLRNLCEAGYKEEAKKLIVFSLKKNGKYEIGGNYSKAFELVPMGLFSEDEVKDILDEAGLLEETKEEIKNEGWSKNESFTSNNEPEVPKPPKANFNPMDDAMEDGKPIS